jgi:hypothetical protein
MIPHFRVRVNDQFYVASLPGRRWITRHRGVSIELLSPCQRHDMSSFARSVSSIRVRLLKTVLAGARSRAHPAARSPWPALISFLTPPVSRGAKTTTRKKIKDLQQGAIQADPLPDLEEENGVSQQIQYPPVLQGVRDNMVKFPNCVVITRVGNFYEVGVGSVTILSMT